jgi:hypothetical protein
VQGLTPHVNRDSASDERSRAGIHRDRSPRLGVGAFYARLGPKPADPEEMTPYYRGWELGGRFLRRAGQTIAVVGLGVLVIGLVTDS